VELLDRDVDRLDGDPAHRRERACNPFLHLARDLGDDRSQPYRELEIDAGAAVAESDVEMASRPSHARAVDALRRLHHDLRERGGRDAHRSRLSGDEVHAPARAGSRAPAPSMNPVEYSPLRNSGDERMSIAASRVVGTPRTSSTRNCCRTRSICVTSSVTGCSTWSRALSSMK